MNVLLFGATGHIGSRFAKMALEEGHTITAFVRNPDVVAASGLPPAGDRFQLITGDVYDAELIQSAVHGQDVVVCAIGAGKNSGPRVLTAAADNILEAMRQAGVRRFIGLSCALVRLPGDPIAPGAALKRLVERTVRAEQWKDRQDQALIIRKSKIDWTLVRPGPFSTSHSENGGSSYEKVARFMLTSAEDAIYIREAPLL